MKNQARNSGVSLDRVKDMPSKISVAVVVKTRFSVKSLQIGLLFFLQKFNASWNICHLSMKNI